MSYRQLPLHDHQIPASPIVLGCMRFGGDWDGAPLLRIWWSKAVKR